MGCQRNIAKKIIARKADYILALKGNQGTLHEDVELFANEQKANGFKDTTISRHETIDGDHGRIETRTYTAIHDVGWLQERHDWPGLKGVVMVESKREIGDKIERETRFYITSLVLLAQALGPMIRDHWAVENSLHWVLDMVFRDDECRIKTEHAPANFTSLKHIAHNLIRKGHLGEEGGVHAAVELVHVHCIESLLEAVPFGAQPSDGLLLLGFKLLLIRAQRQESSRPDRRLDRIRTLES